MAPANPSLPGRVATIGAMKRLSLCIALNSAGGQAPDAVELIPAGPKVSGRDGRHWLFDGQAERDVLGAFEARGVELPIDWEHATQHRAPNGEDAPAAAWIKFLEIRGGALWGAVGWTPRGGAQVVNQEYRYLSPVFDFDPATGRIARLVSAGLTNTPNLHVQALNSEEASSMKRSTLLAASILSAFGLPEGAEDDAVATAINAMKKDLGTAQALNSEKAPALDRYVPRADYDALVTRATNAEQAVKARDTADHAAAVDTEISAALKAGKITPATEGYHRASCSDQAGLKRFQEFVAAAPAVATETAGFDKRPDGKATALNAEQKDACRLLGITEADYAAELAKEKN